MEDVSSLEITKTNLENALKSQFGNNVNFTITDNGDGSFTIKFDYTDRMYYVDSSGNVIENDNILRISTADELKAFRDEVNSGNTFEGKYICLMNDITLDINEEWRPIGLRIVNDSTSLENTPFKGTFDGQSYEINGIYINTTDNFLGLFGFVKNSKISNLTIGMQNNIQGGKATGGIVGYCYNSTLINVCNKSNISGNNTHVGGIAGLTNNNSFIINSCNFGNISANGQLVGGIVGYCSNTTIKGCYNAGEINANGWLGGIAGATYAGNVTVSNCYNISKVIGSGAVGGIVGGIIEQTNLFIINNCYNIGEITGENKTNGIYGHILSNITIQSKNNYYLEKTINGENGESQEGVEVKDSENLKNSSVQLGSEYKEDTTNINNGYPILQWQ